MTLAVRPIDLPTLRDETAEHILRTGPTVFETFIRDGRQNTAPLASPPRAAAILTAEEVTRLKSGELFYVNADMTGLAVAAGRTLPEFSLMPEDLPSPAGLIVFERPIATVDWSEFHDGAENESPIVAASWSHWNGTRGRWPHGGVWISWYADREGMIESAVARGAVTGAQVDALRVAAGRLILDNEMQSPFSPSPLAIEDDRDPALGRTLVGRLLILKAAWLLMQQPISDVRDAVYDRAARRRFEREQVEPPRVRVVTLRRAAHSGSGLSDREFHHQWIVRGHWRQQWYPARQVHRPVWIAPHVKGPEGAPMLGGEKVYAWQR